MSQPSRLDRPSHPTQLAPCLYRLTSSLATLALLVVPPALLCSTPGCTPDASPVIPRPPAGPTVILGPAVPEGSRVEVRGPGIVDAEVMPPIVLEPADAELVPGDLDARVSRCEGRIEVLMARVRAMEERRP